MVVPAVVGAEVVEQVGERVAELDHALRGQRHLAAGPAARHRLRHAQEAPARVLLQVQVIPPVVLQSTATLVITCPLFNAGLYNLIRKKPVNQSAYNYSGRPMRFRVAKAWLKGVH